MDTASLYQSIISVIQKSFIRPAERFGLSVTELKGLDPSIEDLILHLNGINVILGLFAKDDHSEINMAIDGLSALLLWKE
jgi:hypothetical protein